MLSAAVPLSDGTILTGGPRTNIYVSSSSASPPSSAVPLDDNGGPNSQEFLRPTLPPIASPTAHMGNTAEDVPNTSPPGGGALRNFLRRRQELLESLHAKLLGVTADAAAALQSVVDEQEEIDEILECEYGSCP